MTSAIRRAVSLCSRIRLQLLGRHFHEGVAVTLTLFVASCSQVPGEAQIRRELESIRGASVRDLRCAEHECTGVLSLEPDKELAFSVDRRSFEPGGAVAIPRVGSRFPAFVECDSRTTAGSSFRLEGTLHVPSLPFIDPSRGDTLQQLVDHYDEVSQLVAKWPRTPTESLVRPLDSEMRVRLWAGERPMMPINSAQLCDSGPEDLDQHRPAAAQ